MFPPYFTELNSSTIRDFCWFNVRDLTMDDIVWSPWRYPSKKTPDDTQSCSNFIYAESVITFKEEFLALPEFNPEFNNKAIKRFFDLFFNHKKSRLMTAAFQLQCSYVGIRRDNQYLKYNENRDYLIKKISEEGDSERVKSLAELNRKIREYVNQQRVEYIRQFVFSYSSVNSYGEQKFNEYAGVLGLLEEIKLLEKALSDKEDELHRKQIEALQRNWRENDSRYPAEAQAALREHLGSGEIRRKQRIKFGLSH